MRTTTSASCLLAIPALVLLSGLAAQEPKRTPLDPPKTAQKTLKTSKLPVGVKLPEVPTTVTAADLVQNQNLGDEPDFAPMEGVRDKDGNVVGSRRIGNPYVLSFTGGDYTPQKGIDPDLRRRLATNPDQPTFGFVMIRGRMSAEKMKELETLGLELIEVHTWQSVKARIPASALGALESLPFVQWVGYARTSQKIDGNFQPIVEAAKADDVLPVIVNPFVSDWNKDSKIVQTAEEKVVFDRDDVSAISGASYKHIPNGRFQKELEAMGFEMQSWNDITWSFKGKMTKKQLLELLKRDWVHTVEFDQGAELLFHDQEVSMVHQDFVRKTYDGKGQNVGVVDSGIGSTPWHTDHLAKHYAGWNNAYKPTSDHGTHVCGTVFGRGAGNSRYKGAAPGTGDAVTNRIFIQRLGESVSNYASHMGTNVGSGSTASPYPRVVSNSWGWLASGGYNGTNDSARTLDNATYNKKQLWVFASGNTKTTANMWCANPGDAKNMLTVGATTDAWNSARTLQPGDRAGFSRWGTTDKRTKPEICAPGNETTSTKMNTSSTYINKSGTSMSTPLVSGCMVSFIDAGAYGAWFKDKPEAMRARAVASARNYNRPYGGPVAAPQSGKPTSQTLGWGQLNSKQMIYTTSESEALVYAGTFTATGQSYTSPAFTVPASAQYVRIVLVQTEKAASSSASSARINAIECDLDYTPYTTSVTTGDAGLAQPNQTVQVFGYSYISTTRRGKAAKIKIYARSIPSSQCRWAVCLHFMKKSPFVSPTVTATGSSTPIKPNTNYLLTGAIRVSSAYDELHSGRLWYHSGSFSLTSFYRPGEDGLNQWYYSSNLHTSKNFPFVGKGAGTGMCVGTGTYRPLVFNLKAPSSSGTYSLTVGGTYDTSTSPSPLLTATKSVCVDGLVPKTITGLTSTSHTAGQWSNDKSIDLKWSTPGDNGCAGIYGLAYYTGTSSTFTPSAIDALGSPTSTTQTVTSDSSSGYYFRVRARDRAVNYGSTTGIGPFKIDTVVPVVGTVTLDGGASYNGNTFVNVKVSSISDNASGLKRMRYWAGKYSSWYTVSTNRNMSWSNILTSFAAGTKTVYVQVEDNAGNLSLWKTDTIIYVPLPKITSITASQYNLTKGYYTVNGSGFNGYLGALKVNLAQFGSQNVLNVWTSANEDAWYAGRIRVISDTQMRIYPPQNRTPGTYSVRVRNGLGFYSNTVTTRVNAYNGSGQYMLTHDVVTAGKNQYLLAALGTSHPSGTTQITMISTKLGASVIPGVISMNIGSNWTDYFLLPNLPFNTTTKNSLVGGKVPAIAKGATAYFQTAYFRPGVLPGYASVVRKTTYK